MSSNIEPLAREMTERICRRDGMSEADIPGCYRLMREPRRAGRPEHQEEGGQQLASSAQRRAGQTFEPIYLQGGMKKCWWQLAPKG